jgi:hypothetical protein
MLATAKHGYDAQPFTFHRKSATKSESVLVEIIHINGRLIIYNLFLASHAIKIEAYEEKWVS